MRKILFCIAIVLFCTNACNAQSNKDWYLHLLGRGESILKNKHGEKSTFAVRGLIAKEKTLAIDLSSNFGKKGVTSLGFGFPVYWEKNEKRKFIFLPMLYRHFGGFSGTGVGFTIEYDDHKFYWLSTTSMNIGKNADYFYAPFLITAGYTVFKKIIVGGDFETIYSPKESLPGEQPERDLEVYMGPFVKWAEPVKIGKKHLAFELGYGHNIVKKEHHRLLFSVLIE